MTTAGPEITVFRKMAHPGEPHPILSKRIGLDPTTARLVSDGSACRMGRGTARRVPLTSEPAASLAALITAMPAAEALALGRLKAGLPDRVHVVTKGREPKTHGAPIVVRSLAYLEFAKGSPGAALLDFDRKGMPEPVARQLDELGGFLGTLRHLIPGFAKLARVVRPSTSSGLRNAATGETYPASGGMHAYLFLEDVADYPRFLQALHQRAWLVGLGWTMVSTAGATLVRSIVDVSVASPERLVFEGAPEIVPPLVQEAAAREARAVPGALLDSRTLASLTLAEAAEFRRLIQDAKLQVEGEAEAIRERHVAGIARQIADKRGIPFLAGSAIVRSRYAGELRVGDELLFDDPEIGAVDVRDVLLRPEDYDGLTLADPIEGIAYGSGKAKVFYRPGQGVKVHSFAHGGLIYRLRHDAATTKAAIDAAGEHAGAVWLDILYGAHLEEDVMALDEVLEHVVEKLGIGKRVAANAWKAHKRKRDREEAARRRRERIQELRAGRAIMDEPSPKDERTAVVTAVEKVLVNSTRPDPVFRDGAGAPARIEWRASPLLHLLTSETANPDTPSNGHGGPAADDRPRTIDFFLPPPPMPLVTPYQPVGLQMRIEEELMVADAEGGAVTLPEPYVRAVMASDTRRIPTLAGISDVPLLLPSRELLVADGFDRRSRFYFTCTTEQARAMTPAAWDREDVERAYRFLAEDLLADVLADDTGKAVIIAALCTVVLGAAVAEKPIFFVVANQRGSGKTTIVHIVCMVGFGRQAAAMPWAREEEERRKAFFAVMREGHRLCLVDNIPRGLRISDVTLERAATSAILADRVLGESRSETVVPPLFCLTGNNIRPVGDTASRSLVAELLAPMASPENRQFVHPDIFGYVARRRSEIIRQVFTIGLGNPALDSRETPATRFKAWHRVVGSAVEHAAALAGIEVSFPDLFDANDEADEEVIGLARLIELLRERFGHGAKAGFTIGQVVEAARAEQRLDFGGGEAAGKLALAIHAAGRGPLRELNAHTVGARLAALANRPAVLEGVGWCITQNNRRRKGGEQSIWRVDLISNARSGDEPTARTRHGESDDEIGLVYE